MTYPGSGTYPGIGTYPGTSGGGGTSCTLAPSTTLAPSPLLAPCTGLVSPPPAVVIVPGQANPNRPLSHYEVDFTQGPPNIPGVNRRSINAAYRRLTVRSDPSTRGRQYELDQTQAGTITISVVDPLELLNPDNAASPFNTSGNTITAYRAVRVFDIWPTQPGSGNLFTGTDPSFETSVGGWSIGAGGSITRSGAQHFDGTSSLAVVPAGAGAANGATNQFSTAPTINYTLSAWVYLTTATSVTLQVQPATGSAVTASTSTQNTWTRLVVSWACVDTMETVTVYGNGPAGFTFYIDAVQLEFGTTATTFTTSGPTTYNRFTGYVERWPTTYDMGGARATRPLVAVDALAILARIAVSQSYAATIAKDNPLLWVPYNDSAPANAVWSAAAIQAFATRASNTGIAPAVRGTQDTSSGGQAAWGGDTAPDGSPALTLSLTNTTGSTQSTAYMPVDIPHTFSYPVNTTGVTFEGWLKWTNGHFHGLLFAFNPGNTGTTYNEPFGSTSNSFAGLVFTTSGLQFYVNTAGSTTASVLVPAGSAGTFSTDPTSFLGDGQWHYYAMVLRPNGAGNGWVLDAQIDGFLTIGVSPSPAASGLPTFRFNQILTEALLTFGDTEAKVSVANAAVYNTALSTAQRNAHYNRGVGNVGENAATRVARLLTAYWAGPTTVSTGYAKLASDLLYDPTPGGAQARFLLDVLTEIQETERGLLFADRNGTIVFQGRGYRETTYTTSAWTFGENPTGVSPAEYPYSAYQADFDPTYTFSQANLTRPGNSVFQPLPNPLPANPPYGQRIVSQQVQVNTDYDLTQAATFYLQRYGAPRTRLTTLTLNPAAQPALWPVVLSLEISQRVTVTRRVGTVTTTHDYYIEQIVHNPDAQSSTWTVDLQLSPVFVSSAWVIGTGVLGTSTVPVY